MQKLFRTSYGYLYSNLKNHFNTLRFTPISYLHNTAKTREPNSKLDFIINEAEAFQSSKPMNQTTQSVSESQEPFDWSGPTKELELKVQISHPWPEWVELMECLLKRGYFEADGNPFQNCELGSKESNHIRTACLNFARDRYSLIRYLSRKDIGVIAGCGCPNVDRKVVNSGKRLRAHVGIDEGNVCSFCSLRGNCERAYVKAREDEGGRTVDVMRILLTYGLDPITSTVENKPCLNKMVKESVRGLLKEMVKYSTKELDTDLPKAAFSKIGVSVQAHTSPQDKSHVNVTMKQGDWICPKCNFLNFARNIKCLRCDGLFQERLRQLQEDQEHLPLKKGDWICIKCNFLNFAKNTRCWVCEEKPPKRELNPGEWECDSCNYINFRKNMVCLKCDYRRPKASNSSNAASQPSSENGGYSNNNALRFFRGEDGNNDQQQYVARDRQSRIKGADKWRFVEDESTEHENSTSWNEISTSLDFPIAGGKSDLSQNSQKQERWKLEMVERRRNSGRTRENVDEFRSASMQTRFSDDEEMAEWFGVKTGLKSEHEEIQD